MIERREAICRHANWNGIRNELRLGKVFNLLGSVGGEKGGRKVPVRIAETRTRRN